MIQTNEEQVINAKINDPGDRHDKNGWFGKPARYWYVLENDPRSYTRALEVLSELC